MCWEQDCKSEQVLSNSIMSMALIHNVWHPVQSYRISGLQNCKLYTIDPFLCYSNTTGTPIPLQVNMIISPGQNEPLELDKLSVKLYFAPSQTYRLIIKGLK